MSFTVILQNNASPVEALDKTLTTVLSVDGTLRDAASVLTPVILVAGDLSAVAGTANYMTIAAFGRKYFITDIKSVRAGLFEVYGRVDVLTTYAAAIRANSAILHKSQSKWNMYLNDGTFKVYQNPHVLTRKFPAGLGAPGYVLAVAGAAASTS